MTLRPEEVVNSGCVPAELLVSCRRRARGLPRLLPGAQGPEPAGAEDLGPGTARAPPTLAQERSLSLTAGSVLPKVTARRSDSPPPASSPSRVSASPPPFPEPLSGLQLPEPQRQHIRASLALVLSFLKS